ncbi:hypothetical protein RHMOL_Rhmol12G0088800 [Rhododendron molle]|uniref:Uncharacterized protein n=1 Tax=Rhododendron molle TaxID=49168 RepID=A0ACC0LG81_RHOML|nr:hypothetical protein RHMOL_Rhmol12G0088800 [Rhododendron molle]
MMTYDWPDLAPLCLDFSHFNDFVINNLYGNVDLTQYPKLPGFEEEVAVMGVIRWTTLSMGLNPNLIIDDDFVVSNVAIKIMKKISYMPRLGLGKNLQGPAKFEAQGTLMHTTGLGYSPSGSSKLESDEEVEVVKEQKEPADWIEVFAMGSLATLFQGDEPTGTTVETEVLMMERDAPEDPTLLIMDVAGEYKNWTFIPSATRHESESESESESAKSSESIKSELVPLSPNSQSLYFEFESTRVYGAPRPPLAMK